MCDVEGRGGGWSVTCFMRRELSDGCGCWLLLWLVECGEKAFVRAERERRGACDGLLEARERESGACCDGGADFCLDT